MFYDAYMMRGFIVLYSTYSFFTVPGRARISNAQAVSHPQIRTLTVGWFVQMEALEKKSLRLCVTFLEQIAKMTSSVVLELCAEQCNLNQKVTCRFASNRELIILQRLILLNRRSILQ